MNELEVLTKWGMAEISVSGCILCEPTETLPTVRAILQAGDFANENARAVFRAACELADEEAPVDPVTIQTRAKKLGTEISNEWLRETMESYITTANVAVNANIVRENAVIRAAKDIGWSLENEKITPQEAAEQLHNALSGQRNTLPTPQEDGVAFFQYLNDAAEGKTRPFLSTGFPGLDDTLGGGLVSEGLITLAARPGIGKSVMALAIADNVAANGGRVLYESLEMSREQLWARRVAKKAGVSYSLLLNGQFAREKNAKEQWQSVTRAIGVVSNLDVIINDQNAKLDDIERHVRAAGKLDLVIIDHMGFIIPDKANAELYWTTTMVSHRLKHLAKATGIPVLMLCQLNRASEQRLDKRPNLADLRNSGAIEEDSDAVIGLYREDYYKPRDEQPKPWEPQTMEVITLKNRHGQTGTNYFDFYGVLSNVREKGGTGKTFTEAYDVTPFDYGS